MSRSPVMALKRGKANRKPAAGTLFEDEAADLHMLTFRAFRDLRSEKPAEIPTEAADEEDLLGQALERSGKPVGQVDELTLLLSDAPMKKLRVRERLLLEQMRAGDQWAALRTCQEIVALAEMFSPDGPYASENEDPLLVADAHLTLAKAYAELQCVQQAKEHCDKALEAMPEAQDGDTAFKQEVIVLLCETMLTLTPPKPQAALQHLYAASKVRSSEEVKDAGLRLIAAQCHAQWGLVKLHEADATRGAHGALEQRAVGLKDRLKGVDTKSAEYQQLLQKISEAQNEMRQERVAEAALVKEARGQLTTACDVLYKVIVEEEGRLRPKTSEYKKHPVIVTLWRLICEMMLKLAYVECRLGNVSDQLQALKEIRSAQEQYACLSPDMLAATLQQQGSALLLRAGGAGAKSQSRVDDLRLALEAYEQLLELQHYRFEDDEAKQAMARAEALKLIGDVKIAMQDWDSAQVHYQEAKKIFEVYLGPDSPVVQELERARQK